MSILPFRKRESRANKLLHYPFEEELQEIIRDSLASTPQYDPKKDQMHQHFKRKLKELRNKQ